MTQMTKITTPDTRFHWPRDVARELVLPDRPVDANLEASAARFGDRIAIRFQGRTITYATLWDQVQALAGYLQARCAVAKGDRVLLYMQNSPQYIITYYAILRAGAVVVPVNPMNRQGELDYLLRDTGARVVVAGLELAPNVTPLLEAGAFDHLIGAAYADMADPGYDLPLPAPLPGLSDADFTGPGRHRFTAALAAGDRPAPRATTPDDLAVIPYSSGTTGQPKGCMHTHRTVMVTLVGGRQWNPSDETDIHLATLPFFHVTGMQNSMNTPLYTGATIVLLSRWNAVHAAQLIERYKVTRWRSITTMAIDLLNNPEAEGFDLSSLTGIGGGGAAMPDAVARKLKDRIGLDYIEGYGLSETMAATHINPLDAPRNQCLGVPLFGVDARILEPGGTRELGPEEPGEIVMNAPQVFKGYWNNEPATRAAFVELDGKAFFRTGDIAYRDARGYFFMVDRVKRMINVSGFKVWPAEVEALMHRHPDIVEACVVGARDDRRGEVVKAHVVLRPGATPDAEAIIAWCRQEMAAYKCPRVIQFTEALPKSASGKTLWKDLA